MIYLFVIESLHGYELEKAIKTDTMPVINRTPCHSGNKISTYWLIRGNIKETFNSVMLLQEKKDTKLEIVWEHY